jgi:hypothetical protein
VRVVLDPGFGPSGAKPGEAQAGLPRRPNGPKNDAVCVWPIRHSPASNPRSALKTSDLYRGVVPFIAMQLVALVLLFMYPSIATWLPKYIGW